MSMAPSPDSTDPSKFPLNFDLAPGATDTARGISEYAKSKGYSSVGVLHGSTAYGELFGEEMTSALQSAGLKAAGNEEYDAAALDMTAQLQSLRIRVPRQSPWMRTALLSDTCCKASSDSAGTCRWSETPRCLPPT